MLVRLFYLIFIIQIVFAFDEKKLPNDALVVAADGSRMYKTIQEAVDNLPDTATSERVIFIKNGVYEEQVTIAKDYVTLIGESRNKVVITNHLNNANTGSSSECATVRIKGDNFKAFDITFQNTSPYTAVDGQAPALYAYGNRHFFQNCNFFSLKNTLLSYQGSHYFKMCYIRGTTDFIWGFGRAVFERCFIHVGNINGKPGYITANGNEDMEYKESGFFITNSKVVVDKGITYYLGRLWKRYTHVIFHSTELPGAQLNIEGWKTFSGYEDYRNTARVGEINCFGEDYSKVGRAPYVTEFEEVPSIESFLFETDLSYIMDSAYFQ